MTDHSTGNRFKVTSLVVQYLYTLGVIAVQTKDAACCYRCSVVCVCLLVTTMITTKMAELIEVLFGVWTGVCQRNYVLSEGLEPPGERTILGPLLAHCKYMETSDVQSIFSTLFGRWGGSVAEWSEC